MINNFAKIKSIYDNISQEYDDKYKCSTHLIEDKIIGKIISDNVEKNETILDIGCGTGHIITLADLNKDKYLGVDISQGMIEDAKEKYPKHKFLQEDITKISFELIKYDVVLAVYGQVNYIGLDAFCNILKGQKNNVKYMAVIYADNHKDYSYTSEHQIQFTPKDIVTEMNAHGIFPRVSGFSYYLENKDMNYETQYGLTINSDLEDDTSKVCKYYVVTNFKNFKEL